MPDLTTLGVAQRNVAFRRIETVPAVGSRAVRWRGLADDEQRAWRGLARRPCGDRPLHQVAGHPAPIRNANRDLECQLVADGMSRGNASGFDDPRAASLAARAWDRRLLFQLDSDDQLGVSWGDDGRLYFRVEESRARAGDFSNAWAILQCR